MRKQLCSIIMVLLCLIAATSSVEAAKIRVTNTNDSGFESLRDCVDSAAAGDTVVFNASLNGITINLLTPIVIDKDLEIKGQGAGLTLIGGSNSTTIFDVQSGATVLIRRVTLTDGSGTDGGAVINAGDLTFEQAECLNSTASNNGGGFYNTGTLLIDESLVDGCSALAGGASYNTGSYSTFLTTISNCSADNGGGIYTVAATITVINTDIASNNATVNGGGIYADASAINITKSELDLNVATGDGGSIYMTGGNADITRSAIINSSAVNGGGVANIGGAMDTENCTYSGNTASGNGGGIYATGASLNKFNTITNNTAADGGGIYFDIASSGHDSKACIIYGNIAPVNNEVANASLLATTRFNVFGSGILSDPAFSPVGSDQVGNDPQLYPLADNGGESKTHAIRCTGAAYEEGLATTSVSIDQRGEGRPYNGVTDAGAFEAQDSCLTICAVDSIEVDSQGLCDPATNLYTQELTVYYSNEGASANLDVNGQIFAVTGSPQTVTLVGLTSDGLDVDVTASLDGDIYCTLTEAAAWTAPASCAVIPCAVDSIAIGAQGACDPATNTYTQDITVYFSGAPAASNLDINGQLFPVGVSPQTVSLSGLTADGLDVDVTVLFDVDSACTLSELAAFTAPADCTPCSIDGIVAGTQGACDPATNTYTQDIEVSYTAAPASGNLNVNGQLFAITASPQTVTLTGLTADGLDVDVTALFDADSACALTATASFTAPADCSAAACAISSIVAGTQTACDGATNTYTQEVTVTYSDEPATGSLDVNGQLFAITGSPQTVTLTGLVADANPVDATASFTDDAACTLTATAAFTAPASCATFCVPGNVVTGQATTALASGFALSWDPYPFSVGCRVRGRPLGAPALAIKDVGGFEVTSAFIPYILLVPGQSYEWEVLCTCSITPGLGDLSQSSGFDTFTAPILREQYQTDLLIAFMEMYPNPVESQLNIQLDGQVNGSAVVEVMDMSGRTVLSTITELQEGVRTTVQLNASELPAGVYTVNVKSDNGIVSDRFVKTK